WKSQYNMGNYFLGKGDYRAALQAYEAASRLDPHAAPPYVNSSLAYSKLHDVAKAEAALNKALQVDPENASALFNLGLLKAGQGDAKMAEEDLRAALNKDPTMSAAAYNLSLILAKESPKEAIAWGRKAYQMQPENRYGYSLATLMKQDGHWDDAIEVLKQVIGSDQTFIDAYLLLGDIYDMRGKKSEAEAVYRQGLLVEGLSGKDKLRLEKKLNSLH
ncbi:MAG TPA: tetratricopeptide repeat protein, partial [Desulfomonilia bacterium]|nr:tetratricopeptide repeat protein [Desulfomonilia bacterium]